MNDKDKLKSLLEELLRYNDEIEVEFDGNIVGYTCGSTPIKRTAGSILVGLCGN